VAAVGDRWIVRSRALLRPEIGSLIGVKLLHPGGSGAMRYMKVRAYFPVDGGICIHLEPYRWKVTTGVRAPSAERLVAPALPIPA